MQQVSTSYPNVVSQVPITEPITVNVQPPLKVNIKSTKRLGMSTIVIGLMSILLGVAVITAGSWIGSPGIIAGPWILVTGILFIKSSTNPYSHCYKCTSIAFIIVTCVACVINIIFYGIMVGLFLSCQKSNCQERNFERGLCLTLLILHIVGIIVAFSASVLSCTSGCSTSRAYQSTPVIYQQQQQMYSTTTSSALVYMSSSSNPNPTMSYTVSQVAYPNQPSITQATHAHTNVIYSSEQPPQYQEKVPMLSN